MIFRIEDTDSNRFVPGAEEYILESFKWLGIPFDEGVSFGGKYGSQPSVRTPQIYKIVKVLWRMIKAYTLLILRRTGCETCAEIANFNIMLLLVCKCVIHDTFEKKWMH